MMKAVVNLTIQGTVETEDSLLPLLDNYAERLKQRRRSRGLTLKQLGRTSGLTASAIARIERRERMPSIDTVIKLERALEKRDDNTG